MGYGIWEREMWEAWEREYQAGDEREREMAHRGLEDHYLE